MIMKETRFKLTHDILERPLYLVRDVISGEFDLLSSANIGIAHKVWFDEEEVKALELRSLSFETDTYEREDI